jgi:hypothetical protein
VAAASLFIVGITVGQNGLDLGTLLAPLSGALYVSYLLTWGAIGVSLIRGAPQAEAPSA